MPITAWKCPLCDHANGVGHERCVACGHAYPAVEAHWARASVPEDKKLYFTPERARQWTKGDGVFCLLVGACVFGLALDIGVRGRWPWYLPAQVDLLSLLGPTFGAVVLGLIGAILVVAGVRITCKGQWGF
jgi:hypothetical protein